MENTFGYMRISTREERGLQKYNRQETALSKYAEQKGVDFIYTAKEDASGKTFENRTEWMRLEKLVKPGDAIVCKDISRFTREAENGYKKYMDLMDKEIDLVFIDNPTVSTSYIRALLRVAKEQSLVARTSMENTVKLLLIVELDRVEQERLTLIKRISDGISASGKKCGRRTGQLDKLTEDLRTDINCYLSDRHISATELMRKHHICRNTLKKYADIIHTENTKRAFADEPLYSTFQ